MLGLIWFYIILGFIFVVMAYRNNSGWGFVLALATFLWALFLESVYF